MDDIMVMLASYRVLILKISSNADFFSFQIDVIYQYYLKNLFFPYYRAWGCKQLFGGSDGFSWERNTKLIFVC